VTVFVLHYVSNEDWSGRDLSAGFLAEDLNAPEAHKPPYLRLALPAVLLAGSDVNSSWSSNFRPLPDFRYFSLGLAALWSGKLSVYITEKSPNI